MDPEQLAQFLRQQFPNGEPMLEVATPSTKVGGFLIWAGFDGMEQIDRQQRLRDAIRQLPQEQQAAITVILTVTPSEWTVMSEG